MVQHDQGMAAVQKEPDNASWWTLLNTPLSELFFTHSRSQKTEEPVNSESQPAQEQKLFEPLVKETPAAPSGFSAKLDALMAKSNITECMRASLGWAWRGGPALLFTKLGSSLANTLVPYAVTMTGAKVINAMVGIATDPQLMNSAVNWFLASSALVLVGQGLSILNSWAVLHHSVRTEQAMLHDIRNRIVQFSPEEQLTPEVSQMVKRTLQSQWSMKRFGQDLFDCAVPLISSAAAWGIVASYSYAAAGVLAMFVAPYILHAVKLGRRQLDVSNELMEPENRFGSREWGMLSGPQHLELRLYQKLPLLIEHLREERQKLDQKRLTPHLRKLQDDAWAQSLNTGTISAIGFTLLVSAVDASMGGGGGLTIGEYGLISGALYSLNGAVRSIAYSIGSILSELPKVKLANAILKHYGNKSEVPSVYANWDMAPAISIQDLHFHYPENNGSPPRQVLQGISFDIKPGELLGVVGESGCGKTTLVNLLCGIYSASRGLVTFNGESTVKLGSNALWSNSAYLRQASSNLWSMTLRENIAIGGRETLSDPELWVIAERTGFADVLREDGITLDTVLGNWFEHGKDMSGGQHSLLAMTRLLAAEAKFIVLDEPTANLDQKRAEATLTLIRSLKDVTRVIISHDYGIARNADRILVMERGRVVDLGTHDELMERCEIYNRGFMRQMRRLDGIPAEKEA